MKFYGNVFLALCVFHPAAAFMAQGPRALTPRVNPIQSSSPSFSYSYGSSDSSAKAESSGPNTTASKYSYTYGGDAAKVDVGPNGSVGSVAANTPSSGLSRKTGGPTGSSMTKAGPSNVQQNTKSIWDTSAPITVQGGSLRTWTFTTSAIERVQVLLRTEGRPLNADVELWQGPDNTPQKMAVYIEDGSLRPFSAIIETPRGQNAIAIRNTATVEFPLSAVVEADVGSKGGAGLGGILQALAQSSRPETVQGGAVRTYAFESEVSSVQVMLKTDGRPLNARLELLQGPNNNKQVIEVYTEDGNERPFFLIIETPGSGNVVRIVNTATVEFPLTARVEPYTVEEKSADGGFFVMDRQW